MQGGGGGISYGAGKHRRMAESARDGGFSPQQMREQQLYAAGQQQQEEYGQAGGYDVAHTAYSGGGGIAGIYGPGGRVR